MPSNINLLERLALVYGESVIHLFLTAEHAADELVGELVAEQPNGYALPEPDAYARRMAEQAEAWLQHARARSRMKDETLVSKALASVAFSFRHRAHDLAVPSKLSGTSKRERQKLLWQLTRERVGFGTALDIAEVADGKRVGLIVSYENETLGEVQPKHEPWLRPLLPFGAGVWLTRVTGHEGTYALGCNIAIGRVGSAVTALNHALGHGPNDHGYGGDGASQTPVEAAPVEAQSRPDHGGDGAAGRLSLVSSGLPVAKPQTGSPLSDDVVLYREIDGTARATVEHIARHSHAIEWHSLGAGASDLAYSVLIALFDEETAERWHVAFKEDVVARIPRSGGVIRAADVRAWLAARGTDRQ